MLGLEVNAGAGGLICRQRGGVDKGGRKLTLPAPPPPASPPGPDHIPQAQVLQGPAGNMPMAQSPPSPDCGHRGSVPASSSTPRPEVEPPSLDWAPESIGLSPPPDWESLEGKDLSPPSVRGSLKADATLPPQTGTH